MAIPQCPCLWYLRDLLELTGAKFGCGMGLCGACTVHVEGKAMRSCVTNMSDVAGKRITTIEGLSAKGDHPLQKAWRAANVPQCGYCQSGQIMQAACVAQGKAQTDGSRYRRSHARQHLPLRHVSTDPAGSEDGRGGESMNGEMITVVSRRGFLGGVFTAGALILGSRFLPEMRRLPTDGDASWQPSVYLGLEPDGRVIIIAHRSEMGTGIRTSLPMVVADELEADWKRVVDSTSHRRQEIRRSEHGWIEFHSQLL